MKSKMTVFFIGILVTGLALMLVGMVLSSMLFTGFGIPVALAGGCGILAANMKGLYD